VNLSAKQFAEPGLVALVTRTVRDSGLEPGSLSLEVTESVLMQEPEAAAATLAELRSQQVRICIDDFGTGYSSLSYLLRFPVQTLKIDRSFVSELARDRRHAEMVKTIVVLARNLGMDVVAEGVETDDQLAQLAAMDCDYVQGYLLSKPLDAQAAEQLLRGNPRLGDPAQPA
jgi:EAL domain-containing protein (putative c-di-GMP-specific phosphodiesterase class I)